MSEKRLLKITDIKKIYNLSKTTVWRLRKREHDPFPAPLKTTFPFNVCIYDAGQVQAWVERNIYPEAAPDVAVQ